MYGDYECPYARRAYRVVQQLLADEPDALGFVFRHFPLRGIHPHAQHASAAAEEVGLDAARFASELGAHAYAGRIQEDVRSGLASGVRGTPTLYFNGQLHTDGYDEAALRATIARIVAGASHTS